VKITNIVLILVGVVMTTACSSGIETGGPCEYQLLDDRTKVITVTDTSVVLSGAEVYELPINRFKDKPSLNDSYEVIAKHITQGSCSPVSVQSLSKVPSKASVSESMEVSIYAFKEKVKWPFKGNILKVFALDNLQDRFLVNANSWSNEETVEALLISHLDTGVLMLQKEKSLTYLSLSVRKNEKWVKILNKVVGDYSPEYGGVSMLDNVSIVPSPLGGYPDIVIFQTSLPAENDTNYIPGPPMEQVFYYDKDSGEYP